MTSSTTVEASEALLSVRDLFSYYPLLANLGGRLSRRPKRWVRAVDGVTFDVRRGEMLALVGESGCGKSTTVQTLMRLLEPTRGSITFDGTDIATLSHRQMRGMRRRLQMVFQDPYESLDPRVLIRRTMEEPLIIHGIGGSARGRREIVRDALERVGAAPPDEYLDRYPHELSGGQRQRVAIASSLVLAPEMLLADEPVSMLDVSVRNGILTLLDSLRREDNMGILMITHDLSTAAHYADRIAVMYLGRIVECGPAWDVVESPRHPYTKALVAAIARSDPRAPRDRAALVGEAPNAANLGTGCRFAPRCPIATDECLRIDPELRPAHAATGTEHSVVSSAVHSAACIYA